MQQIFHVRFSYFALLYVYSIITATYVIPILFYSVKSITITILLALPLLYSIIIGTYVNHILFYWIKPFTITMLLCTAYSIIPYVNPFTIMRFSMFYQTHIGCYANFVTQFVVSILSVLTILLALPVQSQHSVFCRIRSNSLVHAYVNPILFYLSNLCT